MSKVKTIVSWSSGKDSAFALYKLLQEKNVDVVGILTTVTKDYQRVSMHSTREKLLKLQAARLNLPLYKTAIPKTCTNDVYQHRMLQMVNKIQNQHITHIAFGDLFLQDVRQYREKQLANTKIEPIFPLWKYDTTSLAHTIINAGFKAIITCIDPKKLPAFLIGHEYDANFIKQLPANVDPCGENGEFHTFVYDAPIFSSPIRVTRGKIVLRDEFVFIDVLS